MSIPNQDFHHGLLGDLMSVLRTTNLAEIVGGRPTIGEPER